MKGSGKPPTFQQVIQILEDFWSSRGCVIWLPHHEAVGAGTNNPATILRVLGPEPLAIGYVEPSFRPDDGRYGDNPNRVQMHHQFQVIIKPIPHNIQEVYLESLKAIGIDLDQHDIRFVEDNWESPVLGAWGLGWEVWLDGMEVTQYTYFQQAGALPLNPPACELTYGLERLVLYVQGKSAFWDIDWTETETYGALLKKQEISYCRYAFEVAGVERLRQMFELFELEAESALTAGLPVVAYDYVARCSHTFNLLDTRGAVALSERVKFFARIRALTRRCAEAFVQEREALGFPNMGRISPLLAPPVPHVSDEAGRDGARGNSSTGDLVVEWGVEELASFTLGPIAEHFREKLGPALTQARLSFESIKVDLTPRRIVLSVKGLGRNQPAGSETVRGPAKAAAEKNPKALEGFCRKLGVDPSQVEYREEQGTVYAFVTRELPSKSVHEILPGLMRELIESVSVGRAMRWLPEEYADAKREFNRPIRWILALFNDEVVPLEYAGLHAGRTTIGARWAASPVLTVKSSQEYGGVLAAAEVVLDSEVRRRAIEEQIIAAARGVDGVLRDYDDLLDEVTNLVETPVAFLGAFSAEFSGVPGAVKKAIIGKHVRCFPVYDKKGEFLPFFVGVSNGRKNALDVVKAGFERVVVARLTDARFFIERDTQRRLEEFRPGLNRLTFHEKLGTMLQKSERVVKLAEAFAAELGLAEEVRKVVSRAASLAKADLASQMVTEMTSLQGEMGAIYAARDGESAAVCQAIREHYLPRFAGDAVPQSSAGVIISLADKIDTLVAFLGIGLEPTGSADPFALRREALGVISIALNCSVATDLELMISAALNEFPAADRKAVTEKTLSFIEKRLDVVLRDRGLRHDVVRAALADHRARPRRALEVGLQIVEALTTPKFVEFLPSYLRCVRLVHKAQADSIAIPKLDETLLLEPSEKKLWEAVHGAAKLVCPDELLSTRFEKLIGLQSVITEFFDTLMVMVEDPKVRGNRLALLGAVAELLKGYGDLTALEG